MSHQLQYYNLKDFIDLTSKGKIGPSMYLDLRNLNGNEIHRISYGDHANHLCESENMNMLDLLLTIKKKINEDMIYKSSQSPIFSRKVCSVCNDWSEDQLKPYDLFYMDYENPFDYKKYKNENNYVDHLENEFNLLDQSVKENDSNLYDSLSLLKNDFYDCSGRIDSHLSQLQENKNFYDPKYKNIWSDLSTTQKVSYLNELLNETKNKNKNKNNQQNIIHQLNKRVNKDIPDEIQTSFMNGILISTMLHKENELLKKQFLLLKSKIDDRINKIETLVQLYPEPAKELEGEKTFLISLQNIFDSIMKNDSSDEDNDLDEILQLDNNNVSRDDVKDAISLYVNQSDTNNMDNLADMNDDISTIMDSDDDMPSDEEIHHLVLDKSMKKKPSFYD